MMMRATARSSSVAVVTLVETEDARVKHRLARSIVSAMVVAGAAVPSYSQDHTVYEPSANDLIVLHPECQPPVAAGQFRFTHWRSYG
jgi:hypothetical protein